jgi:hypothetical protein
VNCHWESKARKCLAQFRWVYQDALTVRLLLEGEDVFFNALEGGCGNCRRHLIPETLVFEAFQQFVQAFTSHGAGSDIASTDAESLAKLSEFLLREHRPTPVDPRSDKHCRGQFLLTGQLL